MVVRTSEVYELGSFVGEGREVFIGYIKEKFHCK